jgi:hypothetical protein
MYCLLQVLETVRDLCVEYTRSRLQRLSAKELSSVKVRGLKYEKQSCQ